MLKQDEQTLQSLFFIKPVMSHRSELYCILQFTSVNSVFPEAHIFRPVVGHIFKI